MAADLPPGALGAKLRAAEHKGRSAILAELGIADPAKWREEQKNIAEKLAGYERSAEEQRRAQMSEQEKLAADLAAKDKRIAELEAELSNARRENLAAKATTIVQKTIAEFIDPTMFEDAEDALHRHFRALPKEQQRRFGEEQARAFFEELAKKKPPYAKKSAAAKPPPARRPLSNGTSPKAATPPTGARPPAAQPGNGKKNAKDMTDAELKAAWGKFGARAPS